MKKPCRSILSAINYRFREDVSGNGESMYIFLWRKDTNINMYEITEASKIELKEEMGEKMEIEPIENMNQIE